MIHLPPNISPANLSLNSTTTSRVDRLVGLNHHPSPSRTIYSNQFIPSRTCSNFALFDISPKRSASNEAREDGSGTYATLLRTVMFGPDSPGGVVSPITPEKSFDGKGSYNLSPTSRNIFRYKTETKRAMHSLSPFGFDDSLPGIVPSPVKTPRKVPRSPYKVLDAAALQDDFYLNLVDWSSHNVLAVGLGNWVYLWNACGSKVTKLCDLGMDDSVCSVGWAQRGTHLVVGTNNGTVQIWDAARCKRTRTVEGHRLRVGALAWSSSMLSSGSRDKTILQRDIRANDDFTSKLTGHISEVCYLLETQDCVVELTQNSSNLYPFQSLFLHYLAQKQLYLPIP